jgi:hypothetical protein
VTGDGSAREIFEPGFLALVLEISAYDVELIKPAKRNNKRPKERQIKRVSVLLKSLRWYSELYLPTPRGKNFDSKPKPEVER